MKRKTGSLTTKPTTFDDFDDEYDEVDDIATTISRIVRLRRVGNGVEAGGKTPRHSTDKPITTAEHVIDGSAVVCSVLDLM